MKRSYLYLSPFKASLLLTFLLVFSLKSLAQPNLQNAMSVISSQPSHFEKNNGQWNNGSLYSFETSGGIIRVVPDGLSYCAIQEDSTHLFNNALVWNLKVLNSNAAKTFSGVDLASETRNYITGPDSTDWFSDVPQYREVAVQDVYSQIDLHYHAAQDKLEYDFIIHAGANPSSIRLAFDGVSQLDTAIGGQLSFSTPWGMVMESKPIAYQLTPAGRNYIDVSYELFGGDSFGFAVNESYDTLSDLIIDPITMNWATFLGITGSKGFPRAVDVDNLNNVYCTITTFATVFPTTPGAYSTALSQIGLFEFNPSATALIKGTYIPGYFAESTDMKFNTSTKEVYLVGWTKDPAFPIKNPNSNGPNATPSTSTTNAFLSVINLAGNSLSFSTLIGGTGDDNAAAIELPNMNGDVIISGNTSSSSFHGAAFPNTATDANNLFLIRFNIYSSPITYAKIIGGNGSEGVKSMCLDNQGHLLLTGFTYSTNLPNTPSTFGSAHDNGYNKDIFILQADLSTGNTSKIAYIGGSADEFGNDVAVDQSGNIYIVGHVALLGNTGNNIIPVSSNAYSSYPNYLIDGILLKISPNFASLDYASYIDFSTRTQLQGISVINANRVFLVGTSESTASTFLSSPDNVSHCSSVHNSSEVVLCEFNTATSEFISFESLGGNDLDYIGSAIGSITGIGEVKPVLKMLGTIPTIWLGLSSTSGNFPTSQGVVYPQHPNTFEPQGGYSTAPVVFRIQLTSPYANAGPDKTICKGASAVIGGSPTFSPSSSPFAHYVWNDDHGQFVSTLSNPTVSPTVTTTYTVTVTTEGGCTFTDQVTVNVWNLTFAIVADQNPFCVGGSATLSTNIPSHNLYTYNWSNGATNSTASVNQAGTYSVTVTNSASGCTASASINVSTNNTFAVNYTWDCMNSHNLTILPGGGIGPYSYQIQPLGGVQTPMQSSPIFANLPEGDYEITVTDNHGCIAKRHIVLNSLAINSRECITEFNSDQIFRRYVGVTQDYPGTPPYTWTWHATDMTGPVIRSVTSSGVYDVLNPASPYSGYGIVVTDALGCVASGNFLAHEDDLFLYSGIPTAQLIGECNGSEISVSTLPFYIGEAFTYNWSTGATTSSIPRTSDGVYSVTITDGQGCVSNVHEIFNCSCISPGVTFAPDYYFRNPKASHLNTYANTLFDLNQTVPSSRTFLIEGQFDIDQDLVINNLPFLYFGEINTNVSSGHTLQIQNSTILSEENAQIVVQPSGILKTNNSELGSFCNKFWQGIRVLGDGSQSQNLQNNVQGALFAQSTTISQAQNAISLGWNFLGTFFNGGYASCFSTRFLNNKRDLYVWPYKNVDPSSGKEIANKTAFTLCNFETNAMFPSIGTISEHVKMQGVRGVRFQACTFQNSNSGEHRISKIGTGIYTIDANFSATGSTIFLFNQPTRFQNLYVGIRASGAVGNKNFTVDKCVFDKCNIGVKTEAVNNAQILRSTFNVGGPILMLPSSSQIGVTLEGSSGFRVEDNAFTVAPNVGGSTVGTWVKSSGLSNNQIYRNTYSGFKYAQSAEGNNHGDLYNGVYRSGLAYYCNYYDNTLRADMLVMPTVIGQGIRTQQVVLSNSGSILSAGNVFNANTSNTFQYKQINNLGTSINYYYDGLQTPVNRRYPFYSVNSTLTNGYVPNTCPSLLSPLKWGGIWGLKTGKLEDEVKQLLESKYIENSNKEALQRLLASQLLDAGNTVALQGEVANSTNSSDLRDRLLAVAPFITQPVLEEAVENQNGLTDDMLLEVLLANPDLGQDREFVEFVLNQRTDLPEWTEEMLAEAATQLNSLKELLAAQSFYRAEKEFTATILAQSALAVDTASPIDIDSFRTALDETHTPAADIDLAQSFMEEGLLDHALQKLDAIPAKFADYNVSSNEIDDLKAIFQATEPSLSDPSGYLGLPDSTIISLKDMVGHSKYIAEIRAKNILNYIGVDSFFDEPTFPQEEMFKKENAFSPAKKKFTDNVFKIYPIPATTQITIQFFMPKSAHNYFQITDLAGRLIQKGEINRGFGIENLKLANMSNGSYLIRFQSDNGFSTVRQFVVAK